MSLAVKTVKSDWCVSIRLLSVKKAGGSIAKSEEFVVYHNRHQGHSICFQEYHCLVGFVCMISGSKLFEKCYKELVDLEVFVVTT